MELPRILPHNVPGRYFTTDECDGCAYCASVAPEFFEYERQTNTYYVVRQPQSQGEHEIVAEAIDACPLDAINAANATTAGESES
jgi:ferredoxin